MFKNIDGIYEKMIQPSKYKGIDKDGKMRFDNGYIILVGIDDIILRHIRKRGKGLLKRSFMPVGFGYGFLQPLCFMSIFILIQIISSIYNGDVLFNSNFFVWCLFIWILNFYTMWNMETNVVLLAEKMHNHLPKHGIWGKPVLTHGDLHGENMLQPDDPNVPIKIIDWDRWKLGK